MKKFASVLLAVLVVFSMFSFVVSAANPTLTVSASKTADIKAGDEVKVTVALSENSGLGSLVFDVKYDKDAFEAVSTFILSDDESDDAPRPLFSMEEKNPNTVGAVRYAGINTKPVTKAGTLIVITFKALKAVDSEVTVDVIEATDDADADVAVTAGKVEFKGFVEAPVDPTDPTEPTDPTDPSEPDEHECEYGKPIVIKKPTCKEPGIKQAACKICPSTIEEAIPVDKDAHKTGAAKVEGNNTVRRCVYCNKILSSDANKTENNNSDPTKPSIPNTDAQA